MPVLFLKGEEDQQKANVLFGPFCLNVCEKLNMSSPKPNFVDVSSPGWKKINYLAISMKPKLSTFFLNL